MQERNKDNDTFSPAAFFTYILPMIMLKFIVICYGVYELHTKDIIHRNLKESSIFADKSNPLNYKIGDFGFIKRFNDNLISPDRKYIAPEVFKT